MNLESILSVKGDQVRFIAPSATLDEAIAELVRHNIGSLLVRDEQDAGRSVVGIVTERDILRAQAAHQVALSELPVHAVMSTELITAGPDDDIVVAMRLMTTHRVRHLPVVRDGRLYGIISIGDVVKAHHDELECENHFMRSYIQGEGAELTSPLPWN